MKLQIADLDIWSFLGSRSPIVVAEENFGRTELMMIAETIEFVFDANAQGSLTHSKAFAVEIVDGHRYLALPGEELCSLLAWDIAQRKFVGGVYNGTTWIEPAMRGRGIGAALVEFAYRLDAAVALAPIGYSVAGFRTRLSVYRKAKETAGHNVDAEIAEALKFMPSCAGLFLGSDVMPAPAPTMG